MQIADPRRRYFAGRLIGIANQRETFFGSQTPQRFDHKWIRNIDAGRATDRLHVGNSSTGDRKAMTSAHKKIRRWDGSSQAGFPYSI
jgi:hypothetical protein